MAVIFCRHHMPDRKKMLNTAWIVGVMHAEKTLPAYWLMRASRIPEKGG
mgnify:CR=1 FL=1|jgi:hypothetical protein